jgi:hypothetical protein
MAPCSIASRRTSPVCGAAFCTTDAGRHAGDQEIEIEFRAESGDDGADDEQQQRDFAADEPEVRS